MPPNNDQERGNNIPNPGLKKRLNGWQIFFIAFSAVVGTGALNNDGVALSVAGPGGVLLATGFVGIVAICFMDSLSELIQCFPCSNALVEYVHAFIDEDLAFCVGVAYWATWAIFYALQLSAAANFCSIWTFPLDTSIDIILRVTVFYIICPIIIFVINIQNVGLFGWIETLGGIVKMVAIFAICLLLFYLAGINQERNPGSQSYLSEGFTYDSDFPHPWANAFAVLSVVAFSWIGIEIIAVTAFEAYDLEHLKLPSQCITYVTFFVYITFAIGGSMAVTYANNSLPDPFHPDSSDSQRSATLEQETSVLGSSSSFAVIAAVQVGYYTMGSIFNGFLIFSALSAGNVALYVASRTLYGLAFNYERREWWLRRWLAHVTRSGVPFNASLVSALAFSWVPFLGLPGIPTRVIDDKQPENMNVNQASYQFLNTAASLCAIFVWATECLAFIRYYYWLKRHRELLRTTWPHLNRWEGKRPTSTLIGSIQPVPAYVGLVGSVLIVLIFPSGLLWGNVPSGPSKAPSTAYIVFQIYIAPMLILLLWLFLKLYRRLTETSFAWVRNTNSEARELNGVLQMLKHLSEGQSALADPSHLSNAEGGLSIELNGDR